MIQVIRIDQLQQGFKIVNNHHSQITTDFGEFLIDNFTMTYL